MSFEPGAIYVKKKSQYQCLELWRMESRIYKNKKNSLLDLGWIKRRPLKSRMKMSLRVSEGAVS